MKNDLPPGKSLIQTGNHAGGHLAGNDLSIVYANGPYIAPAPLAPVTSLGRLYKKLRDEVRDDPDLTDYIEDLQIFTRLVEDEEIIGLDGKLKAASRIDQINLAKRLKERTYGQLRRNIFSRTFQTIYVILMSKISEEFETWVRPAILEGVSRREIDILVNMHVVKPIVAELEQCEDYDGIANMDIRGMIYFLTGNCHLCWH